MRGLVTEILIILLLIGISTLAFEIRQVKASGTIYIGADGSINPPSAPIHRDGDIYTFNGNIFDAIVIQKGNIVVDGAGYTVQGTKTGTGIYIEPGASSVTLKNTNVKNFQHGIHIRSDYNTICDNTASNCTFDGIFIQGNFNSLISNNVSNNAPFGGDGITIMVACNNNTLTSNTVSNNRNGITLWWTCRFNVLYDNIVSNNDEWGIWLGEDSSSNVLFRNSISNNGLIGIVIETDSHNNVLFWNNFIDNAVQAYDECSNYWNLSYPIGNYWSDYTGVDLYQGPYQNETGSDGIGDTPYIIDANTMDHYPLMALYDIMPWDITGSTQWVPDYKCDIRDVAQVALLFGSTEGDERYDERADITGPINLLRDGKIDIRDVALVAIHFGESY